MTDNTMSLTSPLPNTYTLWFHSSTDQDWTINSYNEIFSFNTIDEFWTLTNAITSRPKMLLNAMFFIMRQGVKPTWEDPANNSGGCVTWKVDKEDVVQCWENMCAMYISGGLNCLIPYGINGISISPKKNNNILKVWLSSPVPGDKLSVDSFPEECIFRDKSLLFKMHSSD